MVNNLVKEDNLMYTLFEGTNSFITPKLLLEFYNLGAFFKTTKLFSAQKTSGCQGLQTRHCLQPIVFLYIMYVWVILPCLQIFGITYKLFYYFYIAKNCVRHNNVICKFIQQHQPLYAIFTTQTRRQHLLPHLIDDNICYNT